MVRFASNALEVSESIGSIELCLEAGISGVFETALAVNMSTIDGTASKIVLVPNDKVVT